MLPCLQASAANKNSARLKSAAPRHLVPFQLVSPKNACPRPWTERNLYPDRSPLGDRFGFVRPLLNFCVVRAKRLAQIVGTALVAGAPEWCDFGDAAPRPAVRVQPPVRKLRPAPLRVVTQIGGEMALALALPIQLFVDQGQVQVGFRHFGRTRQRGAKLVQGLSAIT